MVQFAKPIYLVLLLPALYYTWWLAKHSLADMSRFRSRLSLGLRLAVISMLILAIAGVRMVKNVSLQCVVFVMDVSDSVPKGEQDAALAYVNRALKTMKKNQKAGIVVFGGDASVELAPSNLNKVERIYSAPSASQTDISQALGLAVASFPEQCQKRLVLFSDGNETIGKAVEQAVLAGANDVSVDVIPVVNKLPHEALLDHLVCPGNVKIGEPFDLKVIAVSKENASARIKILRNGAPVAEKFVDLIKGKSIYAFRQSIPKSGSYQYEALLETDQDTRPENNVATGYTMVRGSPRVLYLEGEQEQARYLAKALQSNDVDVEVRNRTGVPGTLADLRGYDSVILSDVPAWNMAPDQMEMIRSGVKDLGIGFAMIGGENSFGAGGYFDTPIEKALPVDMSVRKSKILPSLSVVVVMDKSGSMSMVQDGREKIQMANDAAASVVKLLQPIDKVGVIVCHDTPLDVVRLRNATSKGPIYREISTIRAEGGGIMVGDSMRMANRMISSAGTRQKHVILLADGSDCDQQEGVVALVQQMAKRKVTVTTVAFGDGPHVPFLKAVAYTGKGDFYLAERGRDLKAIFTKDVMTVSKSLVVEEPFVPKMDFSSSELSGISDSMPPLLGYVTATAKPAAAVLAVSHKNDPILASWQYGLGRSVAFTSDCKARWSARWLTWADYSKFWAQVIRSTMRKNSAGDFQTTVDVSGGVGRIVVDAVDSKGNFLNFYRFTGSAVDPNMQVHPVVIEQTGPGRYEGSFDAREVGNYVVNVARVGKGAPEVNVVSIPYPPEYKDIAPNTALLRQIASQTSGRFAPEAANVFSGKFRSTRSYADLWPLLALLSTLLLPLDVAVRRVRMTPEQFLEVCHAVTERIRRRKASAGAKKQAAAERSEVLDNLMKIKKERPQQDVPLKIGTDAPPAPAHKEPPVRNAAPPGDKPRDAAAGEQNAQTQETTSRLLQAKRRSRDNQG